jgi:uncharacterized protein
MGGDVSAVARPARKPSTRAFWMKQLHQWHWISSALCLVAMLLFAVTGFTLNHAATISAEPAVRTGELTLPATLMPLLAIADEAPDETTHAPLPADLRAWLSEQTDLRVDALAAEWSADEVYLALPRAGGDAWIAIDRAAGSVSFEHTDRGWIAYLNDLHKGRNTGDAWRLFIDVFAIACVVFTLTGLVLLQLHARHRPSTWPTVAIGAALMVVMALIHY